MVDNLFDNNIVVTGATGFIGSNIVKYLIDKTTAKIIATDRTLKEQNMIKDDKIIYIKGLLECNELYDELNKFDFKTFFHCGAITDTTYSDEQHINDINVNSFYKIIGLCKNKKANLIYSSSASIYGDTDKISSITDKPNPGSLYALSKLKMENIAIQEYGNMKIIGLRYFNVYGPGETYKNNMSSMIHKLLNGHNKLFEYGKQQRDFVYVKDIVQANINAALHLENGIYNVGTGNTNTFNDIVHNIQMITKKQINIEYIDNPYKFFQNYTHADIKQTQEKLCYQPQYDLQSGIKEMIDNFS